MRAARGFPATAARRRSSASLNATYSVSTASRPLTPAGMRFLNGARSASASFLNSCIAFGGEGGGGSEVRGRAAGGERGWKGSRRFDRGGDARVGAGREIRAYLISNARAKSRPLGKPRRPPRTFTKPFARR